MAEDQGLVLEMAGTSGIAPLEDGCRIWPESWVSGLKVSYNPIPKALGLTYQSISPTKGTCKKTILQESKIFQKQFLLHKNIRYSNQGSSKKFN